MTYKYTASLLLAAVLALGPCVAYAAEEQATAQGTSAAADSDSPLKIKQNTNLMLLQPLDDSTTSMEGKPNIQIFFDYFNLSWPWLLGVSAGLAVLQVMIGGMMMMTVSNKEGGKTRMQWATAGLLIIALAGMILSTINPLFFK